MRVFISIKPKQAQIRARKDQASTVLTICHSSSSTGA